jgi:hypothetical protein
MIRLLTILLPFFSLSLSAQKGVKFPQIKGATLDNKTISIPFKNGKYTVVGIAFNRSAEDALKKWLNPLYNAFIKVESSSGSQGFDVAEIYDVNFVFIPMIAGFRRVAEDFKRNTDKQFWSYIVDIEKTDVKELQDTLGVTDNKIPYFFVLDKEGRIVEYQSGIFSPAKLDKLENSID